MPNKFPFALSRDELREEIAKGLRSVEQSGGTMIRDEAVLSESKHEGGKSWPKKYAGPRPQPKRTHQVSLICRMVVGYFEPAQVYEREIVATCPLGSRSVERLQAASDALFGIQFWLADYLIDSGLLVMERGRITEEMFQVACVAHELFGMTAVDNAHRQAVYPRPDWTPRSIDRLAQSYRGFRPDWDEARAREGAESIHAWEVRQAAFEKQVMQRVRAAKQSHSEVRG